MNHDAFSSTLLLAVHELRTPITVIAGYVRMLLREQGGPLSDKQRKMLEETERSCGRISAILSEMSELGHLEAGERPLTHTEFDLSALLHELAEVMHAESDRGIAVEARCPSEPVAVVGDRLRLGAAIRALIHAAQRERTGPGAVVIECMVRTEGASSVVTVMIGAATDVEGQGDGARAEFDEWRGGMGLALPIGRRIIERHGGTVWSTAERRGDSAFQLSVSQPGGDTAS